MAAFMVSLNEIVIRHINEELATTTRERKSLWEFHPAQMKWLRKLLTKVKDELMEQTVNDMAERLDDWFKTVRVSIIASCSWHRQLSPFIFQCRLTSLDRSLQAGNLPVWSQMTDTQRELARIQVECCMAAFCLCTYLRGLTPPCFTSDSPRV